MPKFGTLVLFGSGETSSSGQKVFHTLFSRLAAPVRVAILETPAGFQPNSAWVANQMADFIRQRLKNFAPEVSVVPARQQGTEFSPDNAALLAPLLTANVILLGAGSPTYAVRQLHQSLAWRAALERHRQGACLVLASASVLAASAYALPVYEIYKVGEPVHWKPGLDLFGPYGLELAFLPHWDNTEGGSNLDTGFCFMGQARFDQLLDLLPVTSTVVGIDEHTALTIDLEAGVCQVSGIGCVTLIQQKRWRSLENPQEFKISELGHFTLPAADGELPPGLRGLFQDLHRAPPRAGPDEASPDIRALAEAREAARRRQDWALADRLRDQLLALGWHVQDTRAGPKLSRQ